MARPIPLRKEDYKSFTLEDYLTDDAPFKIGLEFEKSDGEIRNSLASKDFIHPNSSPFEGKFLLGVNGKLIYRDLNYNSYPLTDIEWLVENILDYSREITGREKNLIISLVREKKEPNGGEEISLFYDHVHNSFKYEKKPIVYFLDKCDLVVLAVYGQEIIEEKINLKNYQKTLKKYVTNIITKLENEFGLDCKEQDVTKTRDLVQRL